MSKTTIVLIHGMFCGPWVWDDFRLALEARGHHCMAPALPFHDVDPREAPDPRLGTVSLLDYAAALEREVRSLDTKPVLLGHSMGGLLAQMLATRDLAEKLVLLAPSAPAGMLSLSPSVIRSFWSIQTTWGFWRSPVRQTFDEAVYSMLNLLPPVQQRAIFDRFVCESGRAATEIGYWPLDPRRASRVDPARVNCPVLVIAGAEDRITPARVVRQVAARYAGSTYCELPRHAHWLLGEPGWEAIIETVAGWVESTKC